MIIQVAGNLAVNTRYIISVSRLGSYTHIRVEGRSYEIDIYEPDAKLFNKIIELGIEEINS